MQKNLAKKDCNVRMNFMMPSRFNQYNLPQPEMTDYTQEPDTHEKANIMAKTNLTTANKQPITRPK